MTRTEWHVFHPIDLVAEWIPLEDKRAALHSTLKLGGGSAVTMKQGVSRVQRVRASPDPFPPSS